MPFDEFSSGDSLFGVHVGKDDWMDESWKGFDGG
jgi:hypothetical protein